MRVALAVFRREIGSLFGHPPAYVALGLWLALLSAFTLWLDDLLAAGVCSMDRPFWFMAAGFVVLVPAIAMRMFAEERRTGSMELLGTLPARPIELVVGKWLAATAVIAAALALTFPWPIALALHGPLDPGPVIGGYFALLLFGAASAALGTLASAVADHPTVAFLVALALCLVPWLLGLALPLMPGSFAPLVEHLSFQHHLSALTQGVLDTAALVHAGATIAIGLSLSAAALEARRLA